ncbi:MAG: flagellar hook-associated protein FlgK [Chitinophagales bacterium]
MRSTFFGLEIGRRSLFAQQQALDVTGHNIANANTEGYSRQVVRITETTPFAPPSFSRPTLPGMLGTGVEVTSIERLKSEFIEDELRSESQSLGQWETRRDLLSEVELIFTEPSDSGLRSSLDAFWTSLQDLASNPDQASARSVVKQRAAALADDFRHTVAQLTQLQDSVNKSVSVKVDEINQYTSQIANLNDQIMKASVAGLMPNDLKDQRDLLLKNLSKIVDVSVVEGKYGDVSVSVAGALLVDGIDQRKLVAVPNAANANYYDVQFAGTGTQVQVGGGELRGLLDMRDTVISDYKSQVDALAHEIIGQVNAQHAAGFDLHGNAGGVFFTGTGAADMALSAAIASDVSLIAAAQSGGASGPAPGDGSNATALANVKKAAVMAGGMSIDTFFQSLIGRLGVESKDAETQASNQDALVQHLEQQQQSVSGVSLDEEMVNLVRYQHGYNAAARVVSVMDEVIDTIINRLGAGR